MQKQNKYALIIGNGVYEDPLLTKLDAPKVDAERLASLLVSPEVGNFHVNMLNDSSFAEIRLAIANLFEDKEKNDLVLLYFSGHGLKDEWGELHLTVKNTLKNRLAATAIESGFIKSEMRNSRAGRQVIILDCCFSGAFGTGIKGVDTSVINNDTFQQGYGKVILTASNSTQYAFEGDKFIGKTDSSLFTHFLLEGLENGQADKNNDGIITVDEWYDYAFEQVEISGATQRPQKFIDRQEGMQIEIAYRRFVGSYLTKDLLPAPRLKKNIKSIADFIANVPTLSLIPRNVEGKPTKNNGGLNSVIQGDNLLALKSLLSSYAGKIKCVYIDPPYDSSLLSKDLVIDLPGAKKKKSREIKKNDEEQDSWAEMIYPRLVLIRELISDDGAIFVSIDDHQFHNLKTIMDYVFSPLNWMCTFVWKKRKGATAGNRSGVSIEHEYILSYSRANDFHFKGIERETDTARYMNPDNDPRGPWTSINLVGLADAVSRPNLVYEITDPQTGISYHPPTSRGWRYSKEKMEVLVNEDQILWPKSSNSQPRQKRYLADIQGKLGPISSVIDIPSPLRTRFETDDGYSFEFPKPVELIEYLLKQIPSDDYFVLDAFAGSGTTGQAVIDLNKEDGGKRKFILIEENSKICRPILVKRLNKVIAGLDSQMKELSKFQLYTFGRPKREKSFHKPE